ncbi:hypothetical protein SAMN04488569_10703 [Marinilactibacillus piezotolerans]|uniref:Uncharacterized protein n=1 Tax=Marinilactibacillus piezotolerans TaxID=258723 RepID=A0A1I4BG16_9LACT|nr:hypothetical protein [Marinilactibacillus piezotolerans]SFK67240.1 hypothetical protein SAMN04488569_10703 [Marinilactibacillus piezotolerans]
MLNDKFYFPSNNGGEVKGISDSGIETFSGNSIKGLGREIIQNSLDANEGFKEPAIVEFSLFTTKFSSLPGSKSLKDAFTYARKYWDKQNSKKAQNFFDLAILQSDSDINVLRISDFNTSGLTGSKESYNSAWINLTKSSGVSDKAYGSAMGSFGIGKFATFATSSLRTVFYNTVDTEGIKAFQGISRLTSFIDENGETTQGIGYYGEEKTIPKFENLSLDPDFNRLDTQTGTDIFIPGFKNLENKWEEEIISAILDGFLYAIFNGNLIIKVNDILINSETLSVVMEEYKDSFTEGAYYYYEVLTSPDKIYFEKNYRNNGIIKIWILLKESMNNKTAMVRGAGMKIKDAKFSNSLISGAAVMVIEGQGIQDVIVPLENPTHTDWEPKRSENVPYARNYIKGINELIRSKLAELSGLNDLEEIDSNVGEYLPLISDEEKDQSKDESVANEIKTVFKKEVIKKREKLNLNNLDSNLNKETSKQTTFDPDSKNGENFGSGHNKTKNSIKNPDDVKDHTPGEGFGNARFKEHTHLQPISVINIRTLVQKKQEGRYILLFTPESNASDSEIAIFLVGENGGEKVDIISAMTMPPISLTIEGNTIKGLPLISGVQTKVILQIDFDDYMAMEVNVRGIQ